MADGVVLNAGSGGVTAATDDCGAAGHAQVVKLAISTDGSATAIPADATNGIDVDVTRVIPGTSATHLGKAEDVAHASGDVGVLSLAVRRDTPVVGSSTDGDNSTLNVDADGRLYANIHDGGNSITVDGTVAVSGSVAVTNAGITTIAGAVAGTEMQVDVLTMPTVTVNAHAVTNAGTFATQVDGAALTSLQLIDDAVYAEDVAASAGDKGIAILAVRRDADTSLVSADNDYANLQVNSAGSLKVAITAGAGSGGTSIADGASFTRNTTSTTPAAAVVEASAPTLTDGDAAGLSMTTAGALRVAVASGGVAGIVEDTAAAGAEEGVMVLAVRRDSATSGVSADGDFAALSVTSDGSLRVSGGGGGTQFAEDAAHVSADVGTLALAVRRDTAAVGSSTDGDYSTLNVNSTGRLYTSTTVDAALPAGTNNIGDVDVLTVPADPFGANADAASATGSISAKLRFIAATGIPITGTVTVGSHAVTNAGTFAVQNTAQASTNTQEIVGDVAHDAAAAGNPVLIAGRATNNIEGLTQVAAADSSFITTDLNGCVVVRPYTTLEEIITERIADTSGTSTAFTNFAAGGAGIRNFITSITVWNSSATDGYIDLRDGSAGAVLATIPAPQTGGSHIIFPVPLRTTANTALAYDVSGAISTVYFTVVGFQARG